MNDADPRIEAVMTVINAWEGTKTVRELAVEVVNAADAVDPHRYNVREVRLLNRLRVIQEGRKKSGTSGAG